MVSLLHSCSKCQQPTDILALKCNHCGIEIEQSSVTLPFSNNETGSNHNTLADTLFSNVDTLLPNDSKEEQSAQLPQKDLAHFKITDILLPQLTFSILHSLTVS